MAFYFARIWLTDSAAKLVLIAAVLVAKISAANIMHLSLGHMNWQLVRLLLSGTLAGAFAGPWLMSKMDRNKVNRYLRPFVAMINLTLATLILLK